MEKEKTDLMNTTVLAYLGDAVYELYIRRMVIETGQIHADRLHHSSIKYVRAEGQAAAVKELMQELTDTEAALVKRARNKKITSKPKHADPRIYKWATAHEALMGYLYLSGQTERLEKLQRRTVELINSLSMDADSHQAHKAAKGRPEQERPMPK